MQTTIQIQGNLLWKWGRTKHGNYIAICDPIAQTVQADRFGELLETMNEALDSTFRELLSTGDLPRFLRDRGWTLTVPLPQTPKNVRFEMPFNLRGVGKRDLQEAVC